MRGQLDKGESVHLDHRSIRLAQAAWSAKPLAERLKVVRALRTAIGDGGRELAKTVPLESAGQLHRSLADTLVSEVMPLAEACRFLERRAEQILAPVRQSSELREALGIVLIIGPGNYPLFLAGSQAIQTLVAGNAVLWKPAPGGSAVAFALKTLLVESGLDARLLTVLDESPAAAQVAIERGVDKVVLTGSANTGRAVMRSLAETLTPSVMELSGCDAVFVLPGADPERVVEAIAFGMRFNGSATCMAPRRLIVSEAVAATLGPRLATALRSLEPVPVTRASLKLLSELVEEATLFGAGVLLNGQSGDSGSAATVGVTLVDGGLPSMRIAKTDIFAPLLTILNAETNEDALDVYSQCPYALTAAVFGPEEKARLFAGRVRAGCVLVNDVIVASADPRASFGGRGLSGFGSTRGAEGLLEMTAVKNILVQRSTSRRAWKPTTVAHGDLFVALLRVLHGRGGRSRFEALRDLVKAARGMKW